MVTKPIYTKRLGGLVARSARATEPRKYHVISGEAEKWIVVPGGSVHPVRTFPTQKQAVIFAKQAATRSNGEVIIHGRNGQTKDRISFAKK